MKKRTLVISYLVVIFVQLLHVVEEILGQAYFIDTIYGGTFNFLILMGVLLLIPLLLLYGITKNNKTAYLLSYGYAFIIMIDGLDHLITKVAGVYTGIGLLFGGVLLIYTLQNGA